MTGFVSGSGGTRLDNSFRSQVQGSVYPAALEGFSLPRRQSGRAPLRGSGASSDSNAVRVAALRARAKVRRYVVANDLKAFVTLTCAQDQGAEAFERWVSQVLRSSSADIGAVPFVWVLEHSARFRTHVHLVCGIALADAVRHSWPHGYVDVEELADVHDQIFVAAYISKDFENPLLNHRYHIRRGFMPERVDFGTDSHEQAQAAAERILGLPCSTVTATVHGTRQYRWRESVQ